MEFPNIDHIAFECRLIHALASSNVLLLKEGSLGFDRASGKVLRERLACYCILLLLVTVQQLLIFRRTVVMAFHLAQGNSCCELLDVLFEQLHLRVLEVLQCLVRCFLQMMMTMIMMIRYSCVHMCH